MEKLKLKDAINKFLEEGEYELIDENLIGENAKEIIINMVKDAFQKGAEWKEKDISEELVLIRDWFKRIEQLASDRQNSNGTAMSDEHALDEIKVYAKDSAFYVENCIDIPLK